MSQRAKDENNNRKAILPLVGFVLFVALAIIAAVLAEPATTFLGRVLPNFPPPGVAISTLRIIVGVIMFGILGSLAGLLVAAAIPKKKSQVKETDLVKQRQRMVLEKKASRKRQQEINKMNRNTNRK